MRFSYTPINRIFAKFTRDIGKEFNEDDIIEWAGDALDLIGAVQATEPAVVFTEVKNHQCDVPRGTQIIRQIARDNRWSPSLVNMGICPLDIVKTANTTTDNSTSIPVALDCNGEPINAYDLAYYRPLFSIRNYGWWFSGNSIYREHYSPVKLADDTLYDSLVCREGGDIDRVNESSQYIPGIRHAHFDTYKVLAKKILRFSFQEGFIAIAVIRQAMDDETGYPLIPDDISYTTAITKYVNYMMCTRDFYNGNSGSEGRLVKAEQDWTWYCGQAGNKAMMPQGEEEHQRLYESRNYMIPLQRYYSYFGNNNSRRGFHTVNTNRHI